ncbi:MAG: sodium:calcium antiporter [Deltaproteobacteria bacterium]|nr:sodium:calcium antiporter [Deltaproteobacteria bacterium]
MSAAAPAPGNGRAADSPRHLALLALSVLLPVPWLLLWLSGGDELDPLLVALCSGFSILGAAFLLSWGVELAERDIPQSLALMILALVAVLPEYAVDISYAVIAARNPEYAQYTIANMTGANRLLIGLGWAAVVLLACRRAGGRELAIARHHQLEMRFLLLATFYSFLIPLGGLGLVDAAVLLLIFFGYAKQAARGHREEAPLVGPAAWIDARTSTRGRRLSILVILLYATGAILLAAEPFAHGLVEVGKDYGVDEFILVQWVAPLASESPEFLVALLFAWRLRGSVGIGALISSKVNQWTLLVGALPIAYCIAFWLLQVKNGAPMRWGLELEPRQVWELWLTSAQSLFALVVICDFRFARWEALALALLFATQLVFPEVRHTFTMLYLLLSFLVLAFSPERRRAFLDLLPRLRRP